MGRYKPDLRETDYADYAEIVTFHKICNSTFTALLLFSSATNFQNFAVSLMVKAMSRQVLSRAIKKKEHYYGFVRKMRDRNFINRKDT
jgi:hypothetical protein